jgi:hypothetical protein
MSWNVSSIGKATAVKAALVKQFASAQESTKNVPEEQGAVVQAEVIVNTALDFLADVPGVCVRVSGGGSAYKSGSSCAFSFKLEIDQVYGFVE